MGTSLNHIQFQRQPTGLVLQGMYPSPPFFSPGPLLTSTLLFRIGLQVLQKSQLLLKIRILLEFRERGMMSLVKKNKWFNAVSSANFQYNIYYSQTCDNKLHATVITAVAMKISGHTLLINDTGAPFLDGQPIHRNRWQTHPIGDHAIYGSFDHPWENNFELHTPDFGLTIKRHVVDFSIQKPGWEFYGTHCVPAYFNVKFNYKNHSIDLHGLLGQTAHHVHKENTNPGKEGEGEIEGTYKDYIVSGPFESDFKFNRYSFKEKF